MKFEWDENKRRTNLAKHGVDFVDAVSVFADPGRREGYDDSHAANEDRWWIIGRAQANVQVLFVVYTERHGDTIRLISARKATKNERETYYKS